MCLCGRRAKRQLDEGPEAGGEQRPATRARAAAAAALPMPPPGARSQRGLAPAGAGAEGASDRDGLAERTAHGHSCLGGPGHAAAARRASESTHPDSPTEPAASGADAGPGRGPVAGPPGGIQQARQEPGLAGQGGAASGKDDVGAGAAAAAAAGGPEAKGAQQGLRARGSTCAGEGAAYAVAGGGTERPTASTGTSRPRRCIGAPAL